MADESMFRGILTFFDKIGVYDVVLPFIFVFTIVFATLEKTAILGVGKRNLNATASFAIGFLVIASGQLVQAITKISANVVVLLLGSLMFLMLVGSFSKQEEKGFFLESKGWRATFFTIMFTGLIIIFLNAFETNGRTWLDIAWSYLVNNWSGTVVASLLLIGLMAGAVAWLAKSPKKD